MRHEGITREVIGAFYDVYHDVGWGFAESVYGSIMDQVLSERGLRVQREQLHRVHYRGKCHGEFRSDLLVAGVVLVELKARPVLVPAHEAQLLNCLRVAQLEVGLLLNFGPKPGIKRLIWTADLQRLDDG